MGKGVGEKDAGRKYVLNSMVVADLNGGGGGNELSDCLLDFW